MASTASGRPGPAGSEPVQQYAGQRLGLPAAGPGSVAPWGRRFLALGIDWVASLLVAVTLFGYQLVKAEGSARTWVDLTPLLVFWVEASFATALAGGSFGQLATRLLVRRTDGRPVTLALALLRNLLICLVVPPVIYNRDNRGLHDLAAGTVVVRR